MTTSLKKSLIFDFTVSEASSLFLVDCCETRESALLGRFAAVDEGRAGAIETRALTVLEGFMLAKDFFQKCRPMHRYRCPWYIYQIDSQLCFSPCFDSGLGCCVRVVRRTALHGNIRVGHDRRDAPKLL